MTTETIRSRHNPLFRRLAELRDRAPSSGHALVEGPKLVAEALRSQLEIVEAVVTPEAERRPALGELVQSLRGRNVVVRFMDERLVGALSSVDTSQGLLAIVERPRFEESRLFDGLPLVVVAVAVQDPGNLGGLLRTAEAAGATGAWLTEGCADPLGAKALRGSMGAALRLPHVREGTPAEAIARIKARGLRVVATAADARDAYDVADLRGPVAFLFGNEGAGLGSDVQAAADVAVRIPLAASAESLNVGVAAGIVLFEAARQRRR